MRIRSVKPEYWQHRMHKGLCVSASLVGAALLDYADDEGRFEADGERLKGMLLPAIRLEKAVEVLLGELEGVGYLALYGVKLDGVEVVVGQVLAFELHQVIQRPKGSLLPAPPLPWRRVVAIPGSRGRDGKVVAAKCRWIRDDLGLFRSVNESSLTEINAVGGAVNEASAHGESTEDGAVNDESLGKGRERKGKEGSVRTRAREDLESCPDGAREKNAVAGAGNLTADFADSADVGPPKGGTTCRDAGAVIPTVEEVVLAGKKCVPVACPEEYCVWWHRKWSSESLWLSGRGFLKDWPWELGLWWGRDVRAFGEGRHLACPVKNGAAVGKKTPDWVRRRELVELIGRHPANREGDFFREDCSEAEREGLRGLRGELEALGNDKGQGHK